VNPKKPGKITSHHIKNPSGRNDRGKQTKIRGGPKVSLINEGGGTVGAKKKNKKRGNRGAKTRPTTREKTTVSGGKKKTLLNNKRDHVGPQFLAPKKKRRFFVKPERVQKNTT